ncbi:protein kinase family protein [Streptomyces sp.]|uniref:protein kinase family protein n=1 Tax=Streptomyces sp. TaxID=1931 RepID=UPI002F4076A2
MADRSTAAVGVANEDGEAPPAARQDGATSDGNTTDDQNGSTSDGTATRAAPEERQTPAAQSAKQTEKPAAEQTPGKPAEKPGVAHTGDAAETPDAKPAEKTPEKAARTAEQTVELRAKGAAPATGEAMTAPAATKRQPRPRTTAPELHSGHKLARRYQLAECVTRVDGFSSWRALDEKLRRAVGIHILPADHARARQVLAAARSAALLGDPRFVQVLDAVEENDLVYVIHEWLPDATSLADLLTAGPLEPHEAYQMVSQVSQGMAAAHREGLAHLRLDPGDVLRTVSGQYRIRGLAVAAALRGISSDRPQRQDTESMGALLYASLTQRWPYEEDAHGLTGLPKGVGLVAPDQVRAGVHRGLSEIAMRALVNDGATASREESPCTTPEELAKAMAGVPRIRPPEHVPPVYQPTAFQQPPPPPGGATRTPVAAPVPPPALPGRTGQVLKWAVAALLIVAIGLGSWQLADALKSRENRSAGATPTGHKGGQKPTRPPVGPIAITDAKDFDPLGDGSESPSEVKYAYDGDPSTYWQSSWYMNSEFGGLKSGVGVIVDLGAAKNVSSVKVDFTGGDTSVQLLAAASGTSTRPTALTGFTKVATGSGTQVTLTPGSKVTTRYLLVWLTKLPQTPDGHFRGKIAEISVKG